MPNVAAVQIGANIVGLPASKTTGVTSAFHFVHFDTFSNEAGIKVSSDSTDHIIIGISQDTAEPGEPVAIGISGVLKVRAGSSIAAGQNLKCDAFGRAVPTSLSGNYCPAISLESAETDDYVRVTFSPACAGLKHA